MTDKNKYISTFNIFLISVVLFLILQFVNRPDFYERHSPIEDLIVALFFSGIISFIYKSLIMNYT